MDGQKDVEAKTKCFRFSSKRAGDNKYVSLCVLCNLLSFCCCLLTFFQNLLLQKISSRNIIRESNSLDPDQDRHFVGLDLGPNCL